MKSSFWMAALVAIVGSVIANLIVLYVIGPMVTTPEHTLHALSVAPVTMLTVIGAVGAIIVYALMKKFLRRPEQPFILVSVVVFLVSLIPDVMLFNGPMAASATWANVGTLMLMHAIAGVIIVWALVKYWPAKILV